MHTLSKTIIAAHQSHDYDTLHPLRLHYKSKARVEYSTFIVFINLSRKKKKKKKVKIFSLTLATEIIPAIQILQFLLNQCKALITHSHTQIRFQAIKQVCETSKWNGLSFLVYPTNKLITNSTALSEVLSMFI